MAVRAERTLENMYWAEKVLKTASFYYTLLATANRQRTLHQHWEDKSGQFTVVGKVGVTNQHFVDKSVMTTWTNAIRSCERAIGDARRCKSGTNLLLQILLVKVFLRLLLGRLFMLEGVAAAEVGAHVGTTRRQGLLVKRNVDYVGEQRWKASGTITNTRTHKQRR